MKKEHFISLSALAFVILIASSCNNEASSSNETTTKAEAASTTVTAVTTNPNFIIAPIEYAELAEKALNHVAKFEFDAWAEMLADDVVFNFPDGDVDTRTKLEGKAAVLGWWKKWKEESGVESMTLSEFNHLPINLIGQPKGGALTGNMVISYFSNKMVVSGKPVALRMNFAVHFNADKKIDRYITYYDRTVLTKAVGKNLLEGIKPGK